MSQSLQGLPADFLEHYWQRRPLLLRGAVPGFRDPLSADELAGLATEPDVESRIVAERDGAWQLTHGPFQAADFLQPGAWTLLVQAVDQQLPAVAQLRRLVSFLPGWRIDDVMVSFATDGGGVGPHFDNYDVFLLQGHGRREWRLGALCDGTEPLLEHPELRLLADMPVTESWLLEPGDVLYVPPRLAHWGIARGECMTYSIGFRAPRRNELLARWLDHTLEQLDPDVFYRDPPGFAARPGEISDASLAQARSLIAEALAGRALGDPTWFGELVTEPRELPEPRDPLDGDPAAIALRADARLAWHSGDRGCWVFANGQAIPCDSAATQLAEALCSGEELTGPPLAALLGDGDNRRMLSQLLEFGCLDVTP